MNGRGRAGLAMMIWGIYLRVASVDATGEWIAIYAILGVAALTIGGILLILGGDK